MKRILFFIMLLFLLAGCNRNTDSDPVVARINGIDITASEIRIHIPQVEEMLMWEYFMLYQEFDIDHEREFRDGITFGRAVREEAVRVAAFYTIFNHFAGEMDIGITDFQQAMIDAEIERHVEHFGLAEFNAILQEDGFRGVQHLAELYEAQLKMDNLIGMLLETPAEFARFAHLIPPEEVVPELLGAKHVLFNFEFYESEDEAEAAALEILEAALEGADFDMLVDEFGQDPGMWTFVNGYSFASGDMMSEFEQATRELAIGGISGLVRTDYGFHIIKRVEPNVADWYLLHQREPKTLQDRMVEAIFMGLEEMVSVAEIVFLPALDDVCDVGHVCDH
jgi:hypothetical protein